MADNRDYLTRSGKGPAGQAPSGARAPDPANDPLAELARLIGQTDPFGEASRKRRPPAAQPQEPAHQPAPRDYGYGQAQNPAPYAQGGQMREPTRGYDAHSPSGYTAAPQHGDLRGYGHEDAYPTTHGYQDQEFGAPGYRPESFDQVQQEPYQDRFAAAPHRENPQPRYGAAPHMGAQPDPYAASHAPDDGRYYPDDGHSQAEDDDYVEAPRAPYGRKVFLLTGVCAVVLIGIAGAFGYRALHSDGGSSSAPPVIEANNAPTKVAPAQSTDVPSKLIYDRVGGGAQPGERIVPREEQPVIIKDTSASAPQPFDAKDNGDRGVPVQTVGPVQTLGPASAEPKKVRTVTIRPDQPFTPPEPAARPAVANTPAPRTPPARSQTPAANANASSPFQAPPATQPQQAPAPRSNVASNAPAAANAPLSLAPQSGAEPAPRAQAAAPRLAATSSGDIPAGSYAVQVSSHRTEGEAQTSFRNLQSKYPNLLNGRQPVIKRADLGGKGIYYRAMVGPFAAAEEATGFCSQLKSAGGSCVVQRN